jgi:acyl-CoA synthetase (AMP-forming)/AMP-acid ligase II
VVEGEPDADLDPMELRRSCAARFAPHAVPREFRLGSVPRTAAGKPTRVAP